MPGLITPIGTLRVYGDALFVPKRSKMNPNQDPRCDADLILNKAAQADPKFKAIKAEMSRLAKETFGEKMESKEFVNKKLKWPIKTFEDGSEGDVILHAWTKHRPDIINGDLVDITVKSDVWSGQLARFEVNVWASAEYNTIGLGLNNVQITKADMPRTDGRKPANKVFDKVEEEGGSTLGGAADDDDDLPF